MNIIVNQRNIEWVKPTKNGQNFRRSGRRKKDAIVVTYAWAKLTQIYKIAYVSVLPTNWKINKKWHQTLCGSSPCKSRHIH